MSTEGYTQEFNSKRDRKERQLYAVNFLLKNLLPFNLQRQFLRCKSIEEWSSRPYILDKGTENQITFFKSKYILETSLAQVVYASELDLRKSTGANMMDMNRYFPDEEFHVIDITDKGLGEDEILSILKTEDLDDSRIVMLRDQQKEYEEEMYDEFYYFLVEFDV